MKSTNDNRLPTGHPIKTLTPVIDTHGCVGHLLNTAKGWKAYDADDRALGTFPTQSDAVSAVLTLARP
jgi:hypothetical protein